MKGKKLLYLVVMLLFLTSLACSVSAARQQVQTAVETAASVKTQVGGLVNVGSSLINTAQALATEHPGIVETVQMIATQGAPVLSTIQAVATNSPGLVQTAQAVISKEIPTGEPPSDVPVINREQAFNYFGSSQYIFYTIPTQYPQVLEFYQSQMPINGWGFDPDKSHEYANAAELIFNKDSRTATINLSLNPLNNTSVVVITITSH